MPTIEVKARLKRQAMRHVKKMVGVTMEMIPERAVPSRFIVTFHRRKKK